MVYSAVVQAILKKSPVDLFVRWKLMITAAC